MIGQTVSHYRVLEEISRGGMGVVYRARDLKLNREVALKVLPPELVADAERKRRFVLEAQAAAALDHPHIAVVHEIDEADGVTFIAMELIRGHRLRDLLERNPFALRRSLELATEVAEGLGLAHDKGVVHRDLKPGNIMVTEEGHAKIIDFGLAKLVEPVADEESQAPTATQGEPAARGGGGATAPGTVLGTVSYMSPEQARGRPVDHRSDIFSFGIVLCEMVTGAVPFRGSSGIETLNAILKEPAPRLPALGPDVTTEAAFELQHLVDKCLGKDPAERYQTMKDVVVDLRSARRRLEAEASVSAGSAASLPRRAQRRGWVYGMAGGVAALASLALVLRVLGPTPAPRSTSLAVMYFENLTDRADSDNLGRMLTGLLTTELSGTEGLDVMSSQRLHDIAKQLGSADEGTIERSVATEVARRAGVGTMVLGRIARGGERMLVTTELVEAATGRVVGSQKAEGRGADDVFAIAESLGRQLQQAMRHPVRAQTRKGDLAQQLTGSVDAYRAYVRGETLLHRGDFAGAADHFRESVRLDPEFGLAQYRLSIVAGWLGEDSEAHGAAGRAEKLAERLPALYRDVVKANAFYQRGLYSAAIPLLELAVERDPDNKEALYLLSEIYMHSARDDDVGRAQTLMERLLALDPQFRLVYNHLAVAYALQGQTAKAEESLERWETEEPGMVGTRALVLALEGRPEEALRLAANSVNVFDRLLACHYAMLLSRWDVAERIPLPERDSGEGYVRAWALRDRGHLHVYRGEFARAVEAYRAAAALTPSEPNEGTGGGVPSSALQSLGELLSLKGGHEAGRAEAERALAIQPESLRGLYVAGLFAARAVDIPAAERHLADLKRVLAASRSTSGWIHREALEAEIDLAAGRPEQALPRLERVVGSGLLVVELFGQASSSGAVFRERLSRVYTALGRQDDAARTLEGLLESGYERLFQPAVYVRALFTLGALRLERGDRAKGKELLTRFLDHWGKADWDLPEIRDARRRLAALRAGPG